MASKKKTSNKRSAKKATRTSAGQSSDPAVHQLLADRQTAVMNQELLTIDEIDKELAKLGLYA